MAEEKATKEKTVTVSARLSKTELQMAQEIMREFEIPSISALIRELFREMYFSMLSEKQNQKGGSDDGQSL